MKNKIILLILLIVTLTGCSLKKQEIINPKYIDVEEKNYELKNTYRFFLDGNGNLINTESNEFAKILELKTYNENIKVLDTIQDESTYLPLYILYQDENIILYNYETCTKEVIIDKDNIENVNYILNYDYKNNKVLGYLTYKSYSTEDNGYIYNKKDFSKETYYYELNGKKSEINLENIIDSTNILGFYNNMLIYKNDNLNSQCGGKTYFFDVLSNKLEKTITDNYDIKLYNKNLFYLKIVDCNGYLPKEIYNDKFKKIIDTQEGYTLGKKIYVKKDYNTVLEYDYNGNLVKEIEYQYIYSMHDGYMLVFDENIKKMVLIDVFNDITYELYDLTEDDRIVELDEDQFVVNYYKNVLINFDSYTAVLDLETKEVKK